jgi:hypothetical protein
LRILRHILSAISADKIDTGFRRSGLTMNSDLKTVLTPDVPLQNAEVRDETDEAYMARLAARRSLLESFKTADSSTSYRLS